jgi:RNA recognition motif-containing protein
MTTDVCLRSLFERFYGQVNFVYIPKNSKGQSKGMAFVGFRWHEDAAFTLQDLDGSVLDGMVLHPQWATPRKRSCKEGTTSKQRKKAGKKASNAT